MNKPSKVSALLMALVLIFFGVQGVLTGEVPAFSGRDSSMPSTTVTSQFVSWIGLFLVLAGVYVLVRFFISRKK